MGSEVVKLENVSVYFKDVLILEEINLSIEQNDYIAIMGPNGGGKTTLFKVILGLVKPNRGKVRVFEKSPEEGRKWVGYLPQHTISDLDFPINVLDVVLMGRYRGIFKRYSERDREAATHALKTVGMLKFKDRQINKLSGGQLQRAFVARAITREPKLLLLDEPTASIDPEMQKSFFELLLELREKMAIALVTHDIGAVSIYVDKIACLNNRLFYHGPKEEGLKELEKTYRYPIDLIAHEVPHRVIRGHRKK